MNLGAVGVTALRSACRQLQGLTAAQANQSKLGLVRMPSGALIPVVWATAPDAGVDELVGLVVDVVGRYAQVVEADDVAKVRSGQYTLGLQNGDDVARLDALGDGDTVVVRKKPAEQLAGCTKLFVKGFVRSTPEATLRRVFGEYGSVTHVTIKDRYAFVEMETAAMCEAALGAHGRELFPGTGKTLQVELAGGVRKRAKHTHGEGEGPNNQAQPPADPAAPFPSFKYLVRALKMFHSKHKALAPLVDVLVRTRANLAKEVTECLGAADAVTRASDHLALDLRHKRVDVFLPGDGRRPYTGSAVCLGSPLSWRVFSIDPVMQTNSPLHGFQGRLFCHQCKAEDFALPPPPRDAQAAWDRREGAHDPNGVANGKGSEGGEGEGEGEGEGAMEDCSGDERQEAAENEPTGARNDTEFNVVLAVHSHADLWEFYQRLAAPKLCVSLPCCGTCGLLPQDPAMRFDDDAILSPRNSFYVYYNP